MRRPTGPDGDRRSEVGIQIISQAPDGVALLGVRGDLDLQTAPSLCARLTDAIHSPATAVLLDLANVGLCDSTGLRALIGTTREAHAHATPLVIIAPPQSPVAHLVNLTGTGEFLAIAATRHAALRSLHGKPRSR